jgi:hypothetical protein
MEFAVKRPDRCLTVSNEALEAGPELIFESIFAFLGVPTDPTPAHYTRTHRVNSSFQGDAFRQAASRPDPWPHWTLEQKRIFLEEAGATMLQYGLLAEDELLRLEAETADPADPQPVWLQGIAYYRSKQQLRRQVVEHVPEGATVLVVSKGDEELLDLPGRIGRHFPQTADGGYAGAYPADSQETIQHLIALRDRGASHLLLPQPSFWWLDYYADFAHYLQHHAHRLTADEQCILYDLSGCME